LERRDLNAFVLLLRVLTRMVQRLQVLFERSSPRKGVNTFDISSPKSTAGESASSAPMGKGDGFASNMIPFRGHPLNSDELMKKLLAAFLPDLRPLSQVREVNC